MKTECEWIQNLYESGLIIHDLAIEIDREVESAKKDFDVRMMRIQQMRQNLNQQVREWWTEEEIAAAKRGVMSADRIQRVKPK